MNTEDILISEPTYAGMILLLTLMGLTALYFVYKRYGKVAVEHHRTKRKTKNIEQELTGDLLDIPASEYAGSEEFAAIAAVIYLYQNELHDDENTIMTINKIARAYSPWSSKLYFQNQYFNYRRR
jgi:hypothetical protein